MTLRVFTLASGLLVACGSDGFVGELRRPPESPTTTVAVETTGTMETTGDLGSSTESSGGGVYECAPEVPCPDGLFCVAPHAGGNVVGAGAYACVEACVELDDPGRWCLDDASCCDADATCENGFCRGAATSDSSTTGADTDASTSG